MSTRPVISVVAPVYNEEPIIDELYRRLAAVLAGLPGVKRVMAGDGNVRIVAERGPEAVPLLFRQAEAAGFRVRAVTLARPSLDDVFFHHTGRTLAEAHGACDT